MIGYAASLLILVVTGVMIAGHKGDSERNDLYTMSIEVLQTEQVSDGSIYDVDFEWLGEVDPRSSGAGLFYIDHLTHNVHRGRKTYS